MFTLRRIIQSVQRRGREAGHLLFFWRSNYRWLYRNRHLRMDANEQVNDKRRRDFHKDRYEFAVAHVLKAGLAHDNVLDAACGTGYGCDILKKLRPSRILGVDICPDTVAYAEAKYGDSICCFTESNVTFLKEIGDDAFDLVTSFETIEHINDPRMFLSNVARTMKGGGMLIISTPNAWGLTKDHDIDFDFALFIDHLEREFEVIETFVQNSGCMDLWINRGAPRRIEILTEENKADAECYIAVCRKKQS
jgi:2-polyprenyl-3-methyl-5-hydroxy-6-metoxy-1,4-benzoquinol methylase